MSLRSKSKRKMIDVPLRIDPQVQGIWFLSSLDTCACHPCHLSPWTAWSLDRTGCLHMDLLIRPELQCELVPVLASRLTFRAQPASTWEVATATNVFTDELVSLLVSISRVFQTVDLARARQRLPTVCTCQKGSAGYFWWERKDRKEKVLQQSLHNFGQLGLAAN